MLTPDKPQGATAPRPSPERPLWSVPEGDGGVLDSLTTAVCIISAAGTIVRCNHAAEEAFDLRGAAGRPLRDVLPWLAGRREQELYRATGADGKPRFSRVASPDGMCDLGIARGRGGTLVLECRLIPDMERELGERIRESESLRALAHRMAQDSDIDTLLRTLVEIAQQQCDGDAAVVVEVKGQETEILATCGALADLRGRRLPFEGSLSQRVSEAGVLINEPDWGERHRAIQLLMPEFPIGPLAMTPLAAHGQRLGMLGVVRGASRPPFAAPQLQRLAAMADYAALVLWKARMLEEAQAANQAKASFLATMSHELRTPITALTGYGELLADQILGPLAAEQLDIVERMRTVTHHLSVLIEDVLAFASLEAGRERVRAVPVVVQDAIRATIAVIEPIARPKGLEVRATMPASPVVVSSDEDKLRQILVNLAGNAAKFSDAGAVTIAVTERQDDISIEVRDTGIGIDEADLGRLFHPFTQLDGGLTRRHGGTGLGLYISQRYAAMLGGRIDVRSRPREGSVFTVTLPR